MRWGDFRRSDNVDDYSGEGRRVGIGAPVRLSGGIIVVAVVASLLLGINPLEMLGMLTSGELPPAATQSLPEGSPPGGRTAAPDARKEFVARVLGSTEDVWAQVFHQEGSRYEAPRLTLFSGVVQSACGNASSASGPFYCPGDRRVYLDTAFFGELERRFGAPGDFAQGYVIAHEVGHHVQNLLGIMQRFNDQQRNLDQRSRNALSVRMELQADCLAGVWGHYVRSRDLLDPGDLEEGLRAAAAVGDDQIQRRTQGHVVVESFTHGSAEQRVRWFRTGFDSGDVRSCNTFNAARP